MKILDFFHSLENLDLDALQALLFFHTSISIVLLLFYLLLAYDCFLSLLVDFDFCILEAAHKVFLAVVELFDPI